MNLKALVVDDSLINLRVAQKMLEHLDVEVDTAFSGRECLEKVKHISYDIIFLDIMMPEMDGVQTFQNLKLIDGFSTPVVALTADAKTGAKEKYQNLGFSNYISKPINLELLENVIKKFANKI